MQETRVERRLAAILVADVVGYSRLIAADEVGTLRALAARRREVIEPLVARHHGRIFKTMGDAFLIEFASAVEAVACAVAIQRGMLAGNAALPPERRIALRVGVNVGDVVVEGRDLFGDGVNVAARLEPLAEPGGICISGTAHEQARDKLPFAFADRGEQAVKNIAHPVRVHALDAAVIAALPDAPVPPLAPRSRLPRRRRTAGTVAAAALAFVLLVAGGVWLVTRPGAPRPEAAPRLSMLVLPFANLSGDPAQDYLADVITEELTTALARLPGSFVIARSTAFTYKGKPVNVRDVGRQLGVRYVLEGSAEPGQKRVRVTAQLIDAGTGAHLWADQFDAERTDLLDMQDAIVTRLARTLQLQLVEVDAARVARMHPTDPNAEDLAMRCEAAVVNAQPDSAQREASFDLCQQALRLDPHNVRALITYSFRFIDRVLDLRSTDRAADIRKGDELVSQALALDPNAYGAHFAKSELLLTQRRFEAAAAEAERALALNPSAVNAYGGLSLANSFLGRPQQALDYAEKAIRLSPRDPLLYVYQFEKGFALALLHRDEEALQWLRLAAAGAPEWPLLQAFLAATLALAGHEDEARAALARYLALGGGAARTVAQWRAQLPSENPVFRAFAERFADGLRKAGMPDQ